MKSLMITIGNFFFRWRDTAFTLIFLGGFILVALLPDWGVGGFPGDIYSSIAGFLVAFAGQFARALTIGLAYIKRGGLNKQIYAETLVQRGMFAHCRNPLYLGNLLIVTGGIIAMNFFWYYAIALPLFWFIYFCITFAEENFLAGKFGEEYQTYLKTVNRFIPGNLKDWSKSSEGMDFTWKRLIKKEHGTIFIVFTSIALITILKFHFRHGLAWDSQPILILWGIMGALLVFQITSEYLKRNSYLEWDPNRP